MAQKIASTEEDRRIWGRCVQSYTDAFGTGGISDRQANDVGFDGHLHFFMPAQEWEVREAWKASNLRSDDENENYRAIGNYSHFGLSMLGYCFNRGMFRGNLWVGVLKIEFMSSPSKLECETLAGFLDARSVVGLFDRFDNWRDAAHVPARDLESVLKHAR